MNFALVGSLLLYCI